MDEVRIAIVATNPDIRGDIARVFDAAPAHWCVRFFDDAPDDAHAVIESGDGAGGEAMTSVRHDEQPIAVARTIAVTGTGGVGATSVGVQLARCFARKAPTVLVDLDVGRGGVAARMGIDIDDAKTWADAVDAAGMRAAALPVAGGFRVLLAPPGVSGVDPLEIVDRARPPSGSLLIDLPATGPFEEVLARCSMAVLVLDATPASARRAAALLERSPDLPWAVVVNQSHGPAPLEDRALEEILGLKVSLRLPHSPGLLRAEAEAGFADRLWTRWGRGIERLALALERT